MVLGTYTIIEEGQVLSRNRFYAQLHMGIPLGCLVVSSARYVRKAASLGHMPKWRVIERQKPVPRDLTFRCWLWHCTYFVSMCIYTKSCDYNK